MAYSEPLNVNRRILRQVFSANVRSFMESLENRRMVLEELEEGDDWILHWFWSTVLATDFAVDFFLLPFGCEVLLGWVKVASSREIGDMLQRFHTLGAKNFIDMACGKFQHQVVLAFIDRSKHLLHQVELIVTLLQYGGRLLFTDEWGHFVLTYCLYSFTYEQCIFIFQHIRDYFEDCLDSRHTQLPNINFTRIIETCFSVGTVYWVYSTCKYIAGEARFFSFHDFGTIIIQNLLDDSHQAVPTLVKLPRDEIVAIKAILIWKLIPELPHLPETLHSHVVARKLLTCTMKSDLPMYLSILTDLRSAIITSNNDLGPEFSLGRSSFVKNIVLHTQSEFKSYHLSEEARLSLNGQRNATMTLIIHTLISIGQEMGIKIINETFLPIVKKSKLSPAKKKERPMKDIKST